jgi:hypothetical protein
MTTCFKEPLAKLFFGWFTKASPAPHWAFAKTMASPLATTFELSSDLVTQPEIFAGENKDLAQKLLHTIKDLFEFGM